ncbi:MAG: ABC transporter ATP-binding protein, partial [Gammaproteobacteria bacterium]|nr:ABC transporter ATP-binding protein [Gammaproteobacteria bacterium]
MLEGTNTPATLKGTPTPGSVTPGSHRDQERRLDAAASPLDVRTDTDFRETLALVMRAVSYIGYFKARFAAKFLLMWLSLLSPLVLPWPLKIVVDHVVLGTPTDPDAFPVYFAPFVRFLDGMGPAEMMLWVVGLGAVLVIAFGAFGTATDFTEAQLEEGHDTATQTENEANAAFSKFAGIAGFVEFRLQLRLTQALNHLLRAQLFERIQALPMRTLNDQRIGDSLYRVMYDTPALTNVFYQFIMSPVLAIITAFVILLVMSFNYGDAPEVVYLALFILPLQWLAIIPFPRLMRRKSQASRAAGAVTTGNVEEGMSNVLAVQSLGGNRQERGRFDRHSNESFKRFRGQVLVSIMVRASMAVARGLLGVVAFYLISARVIEGVLTPGDYAVLIYYYAWFSGALTAIPYVWIRIQHNIPGVRRVFFLMD